VVVGHNAAGKTNLLEAMLVLSRGGSHRTTTDQELITWGEPLARLEGRVSGTRIHPDTVLVFQQEPGCVTPSVSRSR
jgi:DNA replication and repair protein RecF